VSSVDVVPCVVVSTTVDSSEDVVVSCVVLSVQGQCMVPVETAVDVDVACVVVSPDVPSIVDTAAAVCDTNMYM